MTTQQLIPTLEEAYSTFSCGNAPQALQQIEQILCARPSDFDTLNAAGIVAFQIGEQKRAVDYLCAALRVQPAHAVCAQNLGGILLKTGCFQDAVDMLNTSRRFHPENTELKSLHDTARRQLLLKRRPIAVLSRIDLCNPSDQMRLADGDHWFSLHLKRALAAHGIPINQPNSKIFLLLHGAMPGQINTNLYNMLWIHSHPHLLTREKLDLFDKIFCLSPTFIHRLKAIGFDATPLIGGTAIHGTPSSLPPEHGIVFIGNARNLSTKPQSRPIIDTVLSLGDPWISKLEVWGRGWKGLIPDHCIKGWAFDNQQLARLYSTSTVVLNDHHEDMRVEGFLNPRILDVMAAGGVVLSDELHGHQQLFGDALITCTSPEELGAQLTRCFDDPEYRHELSLRGRRAVSQYTFTHIAQQLIDHILTIDESELEGRSPSRHTPAITQGYEGWISFHGDRVIKTYKPAYYAYNQGYNRRGEAYFLKNFQSPWFVRLLSDCDTQITLQNAGRPIGRFDSNSERRRVLEPEGLDLVGLVAWLKGLEKELLRLGLKHRDLNPSNILYDDTCKKYTLIDFGWMIKDTDPDGPSTHPATLNPYAANDHEAIRQLIHDAIHAQIARINQGPHYDGSSTQPGWVYHPIAFEEFSARVHKTAAVNELQEVILHGQIPEQTGMSILEIGCSIGYFAFNLAARGCSVTAYEADPEVHAVAEAMRIYKEIDHIRFINKAFTSDDLAPIETAYDLTLMLNVHMWIHKLLGPGKTIALMNVLSRKTKRLLFQTAHAQSGGMYRVMELKNAADIHAYLETCGFTNVQHIRDTDAHHGIRSLFLCEGCAP